MRHPVSIYCRKNCIKLAWQARNREKVLMRQREREQQGANLWSLLVGYFLAHMGLGPELNVETLWQRHSLESRAKISAALVGKKRPPEVIAKIKAIKVKARAELETQLLLAWLSIARAVIHP
jgi:hypothetical protein